MLNTVRCRRCSPPHSTWRETPTLARADSAASRATRGGANLPYEAWTPSWRPGCGPQRRNSSSRTHDRRLTRHAHGAGIAMAYKLIDAAHAPRPPADAPHTWLALSAPRSTFYAGK